MIHSFRVKTRSRCELIDITQPVTEYIKESKIKEGVCVIFVPHTTAAVTINENYDPSVCSDISSALKRLIPAGDPYEHSEGNADAHIKASIIGSSRTIFIEDGKPAFGSWQGIFLCEFDGPRTREVWIKVIE